MASYLLTITSTVFWCALLTRADDLCLVTGVQCSTNCEDIILCPKLYATPMKVLTCKGLCGTDAQGKPNCHAETCDNGVFMCTSSGSEPHPVNATTYYTCPGVGTRGTQRACEPGTFYNATTERCSQDTTPHEPITCTEPAQMGEVDQDGAFCYICDNLNKPLLYPCDMDSFNGLFFQLFR